MTDALLAATFPVFKLDGTVSGDLARDLVRLEVDETTAGLKHLKASFIAVGPGSGAAEQLVHLDGSDLDFGKRLEVSVGAPGEERIVFKGLVSAIELEHAEGDQPFVSVFADGIC